MSLKPDDAKAELIEQVAATAAARLPGARGTELGEFVRRYYAGVAPDDLSERDVLDLYGMAMAHWNLATGRSPGGLEVRVYTPSFDRDGWQTTHTVVEIVADDMPFLVDSTRMELNRHSLAVHLLVHPVLDGTAFIHVEVDRLSDPDLLAEIRRDLLRVLGDNRAAVEDWPAMVAAAQRVAEELERRPPPVDPEELAETEALLTWMADDHFTFLGYREYELSTVDGEDVLRAVDGTGLGILRQSESDEGVFMSKMPPEVRALARSRTLLNLTKANSRATVHRPAYLDYVGVKRFDDAGRPYGEWRFLGLYNSEVYRSSAVEIPVMRRRVARVLERAGFPESSHSGKDLASILENYPRDDLLQITDDELFSTAMGILRLAERQRVRLFVHRDRFGRYLSCLVFLPRERYNTDTRVAIQKILLDAFHGTGIEYQASVSESMLARLHFLVNIEPGEHFDVEIEELERRIAAVVRSWSDELREALIEERGEGQGVGLHHRYRDAFAPAYRHDYVARTAVADIARLESLGPDGALAMHLYRPLEAAEGFLRFKLYRSGVPLLISDVLPVLEHMGAKVLDERPYEVRPDGGPPLWIYDFGLSCAAAFVGTEPIDETFQDAFAAVWAGEAEDDGFNRLVLLAGLGWRDVTVLRAYARHLRQIGTAFSQSYMEATLAAHPTIARLLVDLFHARFDPDTSDGERTGGLVARVTEAVDEVTSLDEDRILRSFLHLVRATVRTNAFQQGADGRPKPWLSFKIEPAKVPDLPKPRPMFEIFVYAPRMEGIHLRGGLVARGGIRWSDRREDFRTEILGLMKAQMVKNAVIVPVGAKGGFVVKQPPAAGGEALAAEVLACYRTLIRGMLDLTDNLVGGKVVPPPRVVRYDGDDPYLVVAADKGTASFSDVANELSAEYGFWLGDAFASGGSSGYDHKRMAITARGAWESVKRHFRALGVDVGTTPVTVVGIGDMSGDVFGNGLLQSPHLRLVAAFDHRHVFIDPDPDPETSFAERARLFALPRSSWDDYDRTRISPGGGVWPRTAKSIPLSPEVQAALGLTAESVAPAELVRAILRAPVDLLWNGGIGTYVKATTESNADVGDKTNDTLRVDATELRCQVVGEGGNLGLTQAARVEFARAGGHVNTDAIDNSAGVDCSDHEVNIKILLDAVVADGDMTLKQRNALLAEMTDEVAALVLRHNYRQTQALANATVQAASLVDVHARYVRSLQQLGRLDREIEFLPSEEGFAERKIAGEGLTSPEFAVLLAHTKIALHAELLASDVPEDAYLRQELEEYFPTPLQERFRDRMDEHRLRREIVATGIANDMVDRGGTTLAFRMADETGAGAADIARAWAFARDVFDLPAFWTEVEALDDQVPAAVQTTMFLEGRKLVERGTRWALRHRGRPLDIAAAVEALAPGVRAMATALPRLLVDGERQSWAAAARRLTGDGVPADLANHVAGFEALYAGLDLVEVAAEVDEPVEVVAAVYLALGDRLDLHWLRDQIVALPRDNRWQSLARAALREDLYAQQRALAAEVLRASEPGTDPAARIESWLAGNRDVALRGALVISDIKAAGAADLATLSVALRENHNLVSAGRR